MAIEMNHGELRALSGNICMCKFNFIIKIDPRPVRCIRARGKRDRSTKNGGRGLVVTHLELEHNKIKKN